MFLKSSNNFYDDLIRCYYIKCDQARRKNKMEEHLKVADKIIEITVKTKDYVQQSQDYLYVAEVKYFEALRLKIGKILILNEL